MTKFDNYIYLTICETTLELFSKTNFSTYFNYCNNMNLSLKSGVLDKREESDIRKIMDDLNLIYYFDNKTCAKYISEYFDSNRYIDFQKCVLATKKCFSNSFD